MRERSVITTRVWPSRSTMAASALAFGFDLKGRHFQIEVLGLHDLRRMRADAHQRVIVQYLLLVWVWLRSGVVHLHVRLKTPVAAGVIVSVFWFVRLNCAVESCE